MEQRRNAPIVFLGYRLAGISLKQVCIDRHFAYHHFLTSRTKVLCTARSDTGQNTNASQWAKNVVGLMLFGTPHANEDNPDSFSKAFSIMIKDRSVSTANMSEMDSVQVALSKIASDFTSHKFSFNCLNFVESEPQKYGRRKVRKMFRRSERVVGYNYPSISRATAKMWHRSWRAKRTVRCTSSMKPRYVSSKSLTALSRAPIQWRCSASSVTY
jgi:hypothetical protein